MALISVPIQRFIIIQINLYSHKQHHLKICFSSRTSIMKRHFTNFSKNTTYCSKNIRNWRPSCKISLYMPYLYRNLLFLKLKRKPLSEGDKTNLRSSISAATRNAKSNTLHSLPSICISRQSTKEDQKNREKD